MNATQTISVPENNKKLVLRWFEEIWNQSRRETIHELLASDGVIHDGPVTINGPAEFDKFYDALHAEFTDFRITPDLIFAENDLVCLRWTSECRHIASGKETKITGISVVRVTDGKFIEAWQNWDAARLSAQLPGVSLQGYF